MIIQGWQKVNDTTFQPYSQRSKELTMQNDCILWGSWVVIPDVGRERVMQMLHEGHPGMTRMKEIAQGVVWWPGIDAEIERKIKECPECQMHQKSQPMVPYTHGNGQVDHGLDYTLILLDNLKVECFCLFLIHISNDWMSFLCSIPIWQSLFMS